MRQSKIDAVGNHIEEQLGLDRLAIVVMAVRSRRDGMTPRCCRGEDGCAGEEFSSVHEVSLKDGEWFLNRGEH